MNYKNIKILSLAFVFLFVFNSKAQIDTNYIKPIDNFIAVGMSLGGMQNNFDLRGSNLNYELNSNIVPNIGLWFKYKKLPALAIGIPITSVNSDTLAKSKGIKISLKSQVARGFIVDGYFFYLKGFNFNNEKNKNVIQAMYNTYDININLELFYIFSYKKFSYKNAYLFGELQKKSKGTFTAGLSTGFTSLSTKIPFFKIVNAENKDLDFQAINTFSISLQGGYLHTFIFGKNKKWFTNLGIFLGPNFHFGAANYYRSKEKNNFNNLGLHFKYKLSIGYNINRLSIRLFGDGNSIGFRPSQSTSLNNSVIAFKLGSIYRF